MASLPYPQLSHKDFVDLKTRLFRRVHAHAMYLDKRWQEYCSTKYSRRVEYIQERDPDSMREHWYYGELSGVQYYDMIEANDGYHAGPFGPGYQPEERLRKAVLTWNTCINVAVGVWEYLERVLKGDPNFVKLECKQAQIRPRLILFGDLDCRGDERVIIHNYIIIRFVHGISFVLDLSGYQFGFNKVLYTLWEYERDIIGQKIGGEYNVPQQKQIKEKMASEGVYPANVRANELIRFAWCLCRGRTYP